MTNLEMDPSFEDFKRLLEEVRDAQIKLIKLADHLDINPETGEKITEEVERVPAWRLDRAEGEAEQAKREATELRTLLSEVLNSKSVVGSHPIKSYLSEPLLKRVEEAFKGVCSTCAGTGFVSHDCGDSTCGQSADGCSDCTRNT